MHERAVPVNAQTEFRSTAEGHTFNGYAALFDTDSEPFASGAVESVRPGAFGRAIGDPTRKTFVVDHNPERLLSSTTSGKLRLAEDSTGLLTTADLPDTSYVRDLRELHERGETSGMSFEFSPRKGGSSWDKTGTRRTLTDVKLFHVTILQGHSPRYAGTTAELRALADDVGTTPEDLDDLLDAIREGRDLADDQREVLRALVERVDPEGRALVAQAVAVEQTPTPNLDAARAIIAQMSNTTH